ncbi:MAG: helix-turn-helix domain-containing protein [Thermomicrobiales bacterium]
MEIPESFGQWLKGERKKRRLTQQALGQHVSYSADHIRKVEADERHFGEAQARLLVEFLGIPLADRDAFVAWAHGGPTALSLATSDQPLPDKERRDASLAAEHESDRGDHAPAMPADPSPEAIESPQAQAPRRFHWLWAGSAIVVMALFISLVLIAYQRGHAEARGRIVPGGRWLNPDQNFSIRGDTLHLAALAYPARADDPPISSVNFTVSWSAPDGDWRIACTAASPTTGATDRYECDWNLADARVPDGVLTMSFDVYDTRGNANMAPNGIHEGAVQR